MSGLSVFGGKLAIRADTSFLEVTKKRKTKYIFSYKQLCKSVLYRPSVTRCNFSRISYYLFTGSAKSYYAQMAPSVEKSCMKMTDKGYAYYSAKYIPELFLLERVPVWSIFGNATFQKKSFRDKAFSKKREKRIKGFLTDLSTLIGDSRLFWFWRLELSPSQNYHIHFVLHTAKLTPEQVCSACRDVAKKCGMFSTVEPFRNQDLDDHGVRLGLRYVTKLTPSYTEIECGCSRSLTRYLERNHQ